MVGVARQVPVEIELVDPAVAPDLLGGTRHLGAGEALGRGDPLVDEEIGELSRGIRGERRHGTKFYYGGRRNTLGGGRR